jgi:hypothetical protein
VSVFQIQKETFKLANIKPCLVQQLILVWTTVSISSVSGLCWNSCLSTKKQDKGQSSWCKTVGHPNTCTCWFRWHQSSMRRISGH